MFNSLTFWTLVAGLIVFLAKFFQPSFPLTQDQILAAIVFLLGLVNVYPTVRGLVKRLVTFSDLLKSKPFWVLIAGLAGFVVRYYFPTFPLDDMAILGALIFILGFFNINPELRAKAQQAKPANVKGKQPK